MCSGGEQEADFAHVSRVFGRMLSARRFVDVVATDVAAGLILLRHVQKAEVCCVHASACVVLVFMWVLCCCCSSCVDWRSFVEHQAWEKPRADTPVDEGLGRRSGFSGRRQRSWQRESEKGRKVRERGREDHNETKIAE